MTFKPRGSGREQPERLKTFAVSQEVDSDLFASV